jgi:uncharacterized protein (UPF0335 family)
MDTGGIAGDQLRSLLDRYGRLQDEIDELNDDKSELMKEVEGQGFDKKVFKIVFKRQRMGKEQCDEEDSLVELYERAIEDRAGEEPAHSRAGARRAREAAPAEAAL